MSWSLIGWALVVQLGLLLCLAGALFLFLAYPRMRIAFRMRLTILRCSRGQHGEFFLTVREQTSWFEEGTHTYIVEITRFKRCCVCWERIEGSEVTEVHDEIVYEDLIRNPVLALSTHEIIRHFKLADEKDLA